MAIDPYSLIGGLGAGASIIQGILGRSASKKAEKARIAGINQGLAEYGAQSDIARGDVNAGADRAVGYLSPYTEGGGNALKLYLDAVGANGADAQSAYYKDFQDDPGFQAALEQGQKQIEHSRIVRGSSASGGAMKELYSYGENARLGAFKDRLAQLSSLSSLGLQASGQAGNIETSRGTTLADIALKRGDKTFAARTGIGEAQASGITNRANILGDTIKGITSSGIVAAGGKDVFNTLYARPTLAGTGLAGGSSGGLNSGYGNYTY